MMANDGYIGAPEDQRGYWDDKQPPEEEDDGPLCLGCHSDLEVDSDGYCADCNDENDEL